MPAPVFEFGAQSKLNLARGSSRRAGNAGRSQVRPGENFRAAIAARIARHAAPRDARWTVAEAAVAAEFDRRRDIAEIARVRRVSPGTVRAQLRTIFAMTGARRQSALVALVLRYCRVPRQGLG
jgi:DNA-binding CsgD family transcriptional regulator